MASIVDTQSIDLLEAVYAVDAAEPAWMDGILEQMARLFPGCALVAHTYDGSRPDQFRVSPLRVHSAPKEAHLFHETGIRQISRPQVEQTYLRYKCAFGSDITPPEIFGQFERALGRFGIRDNFGINGLNLDGTGLMVCLLVSKKGDLTPHRGADFERIGRHLAAAVRLRGKLAAKGKSAIDDAEAVLDATGRVHHAAPAAKSKSKRDRLRDLVVGLERSRAGNRRRKAVLGDWTALFDARWSLVDHFDRDGRRFIVAAENCPRAAAETLSRREAQVVAYAAQGFTVKEIGYELGIAATTVRVLRARARKKLT